MKKYLLLLLVPVIVIIFWATKEEKVVLIPESARTSHSQKSTKSKAAHKQIFYGKRQSVATDSKEPCDSVRKALEEMDFYQNAEETLKNLKSDLFNSCTHSDFAEKLAQIKQACFGEKINKDFCLVNLVFLRGAIRARLIKDPRTREELADMIAAEFSKKAPDFKKLREFSKKLLDQDPRDIPVQKVWALSSVASTEDPSKMSDNLVNEIYNTLDPELFANDPQMRGLDIMLKTKLEPLSVEEYTRRILEREPNDLANREFLGWSLWQQGRREEALAQIDYIISKNNDSYLADMRAKLVAPNAGKEAYAGRINIGIRLEDLWE